MIKTIGTVLLAAVLVWSVFAICEDVDEVILTSDVMELAGKANPRTVLASTYVVTGQSVTFHMWLVDTSSQQVLSTGSFEVAMNQEIEGLLRGTPRF